MQPTPSSPPERGRLRQTTMCDDKADRLARAVPKLRCPSCGEFASRVIRSVPDNSGDVYERERRCEWCGFVYETEERVKRSA